MKMKSVLGAAVLVHDSLPVRLDKQLTGWWSVASRVGRGSSELRLRSHGIKTAKILSHSKQ